MILFTFDVDWVPDFVLDSVYNVLNQYDIKATFFCTSPNNGSLWNSHIEKGIHPNFMDDSTQGTSEDDVLRTMVKWYPSAVGVRAHRLYFHSGLIGKYIKSGLRYDCSVLLPFHSHLEPVKMGTFVRFPYWWGDNVHLSMGLPCHKIQLPNFDKPGLKIFDFHPIHIYLNTSDLNSYYSALNQLQPLHLQTPETFAKFRQGGKGMETFFHHMCRHVQNEQSHTNTLEDLLT